MQTEPRKRGALLDHEKHIEMIAELVAADSAQADGRALFDDNLSMVVSDVLRLYTPFREAVHAHPEEWYVVGVMTYALGETSRKPLPVNLISLGTLVKRVRERMRERGGAVPMEPLLAITDLFSLELFKEDNGNKERIAEVPHDYMQVLLGGDRP